MEMTSYEQKQFDAIEKWEKEEPSVVAQAVGYALKPLTWALQKVIPAKAIEGALTGFDRLALFVTDNGDILRDGQVKSIEELKHKDLKLSDKLADGVKNWAVAISGVEGGGTGWVGLPGLIVDIPALITLSLRTIHKIGLCYGYECYTPEERMRVYQIMSAAGANTMKEKVAAITFMRSLEIMIAKTTWKKIAEKAAANKVGQAALINAVRTIAKQLGINITKRKALAAIPILGLGISAAMNMAFIKDVAEAAIRTYQHTWLIENGKIQQDNNGDGIS